MRDRDWWKEPIESHRLRTLFHAVCEHPGDDVADHVLGYVVGRPWFQALRPRFERVAQLDRTGPCRSADVDPELHLVLCDLYAASRVRDALLLAHQPPPLDPEASRATDRWLSRTEPTFAPLPLDAFTAFFAALGCRPHDAPGFDPIVHEIVACDPADEPDAPITVVDTLWPALLIGELVFGRAGVRVRAGSQHAAAGVADRSTLHHTYWRRHRPTADPSMGWGSNSQWGTWFRRDYLTERGPVFDLDAPLDAPRHADPSVVGERPTDAEIDAARRHRSWLIQDRDEDAWPGDETIDDRPPG